MTNPRTLSPAASAIKRKTMDRILDAIPLGVDVTPREAWRLAGKIGAPGNVRCVLRELEREGRIILAGKTPVKGDQIGTNLYRRRL